MDQEIHNRIAFAEDRLYILMDMIMSNNPDRDIDFMQWVVKQDAELTQWWSENVRAETERQMKREKIEMERLAKEAALAKLTPEEKKILRVQYN